MAEYSPSIRHWLDLSEGGYVDNPKDPGGATNHGVTRKVLAAWRGVSPWWKLSKQTVKNLSLSEAQAIFKAHYWDPVKGDHLPSGVDYAVFDYAVNSGVSRAVKDLQRCLGKAYTGRIDGIMGTITLAAVQAADAEHLIRDLCNRRYTFLKNLSTFRTFGKGWTRRVMGNRVGAQPGRDIGVIDRAIMLHRGEADIPAPVPAPHKAEPEPAKIKDLMKTAAGAGLTVSGAGGLLAAVADNRILSVALALVIVAGAGLAFYWIFTRMRRGELA